MNKINYKLMAIDVDGTLLNSEYQISKGAPVAIGKLADNGIHAVLVSGRSILLLQDFMTRLRTSKYYIGSGGAKVASTTGEVIALTPVQRLDAEEIARKALTRGMGVCFHESNQQHCEIYDPNMRARMVEIGGSKIRFIDDILSNTTHAPEKVTVFGDRPELERLQQELSEGCIAINMTFSGPNYLEITHQSVSKGAALKQLIEHLMLEPEKVIAIGDQQNDISMFKVAGLAIAMGNATPEVKSVATLIAPSNDEGGLAWAINELVLN
jgi:Cof subfamily protein (haloacid dehalogenase superfamily)